MCAVRQRGADATHRAAARAAPRLATGGAQGVREAGGRGEPIRRHRVHGEHRGAGQQRRQAAALHPVVRESGDVTTPSPPRIVTAACVIEL